MLKRTGFCELQEENESVGYILQFIDYLPFFLLPGVLRFGVALRLFRSFLNVYKLYNKNELSHLMDGHLHTSYPARSAGPLSCSA